MSERGLRRTRILRIGPTLRIDPSQISYLRIHPEDDEAIMADMMTDMMPPPVELTFMPTIRPVFQVPGKDRSTKDAFIKEEIRTANVMCMGGTQGEVVTDEVRALALQVRLWYAVT